MPTGEIRFVGTEGSTKTAWEPMTMTLVGSVAALIQGGVMGSRGDGGVTKKV
jgi:hypothetical protein